MPKLTFRPIKISALAALRAAMLRRRKIQRAARIAETEGESS